MNTHLKISTRKNDATPMLIIKGDITAVTGGAITDVYNGEDISNAERITLHFDQSCYINSGGIAFLIEILRIGRKKGQKICASGLSDHYRMIFRMLGLTRYMEIFPAQS